MAVYRRSKSLQRIHEEEFQKILFVEDTITKKVHRQFIPANFPQTIHRTLELEEFTPKVEDFARKSLHLASIS
jgi:hypothetical protein